MKSSFALGVCACLFYVACSLESPSDSPDGGAGTSTGGAAGTGGAVTAGSSASGATATGGTGGSTSGGAGAGGAAAGSTSGGSAGVTSGGAGAGSGGGGAGSGGAGSGGAGSGGAAAGSAGAAGTGGGAAGGGSGGASGAGGAGGASAGAGGSGGSAGFQPCPATGTCRILPLGDSITDGFGTPGGYRIELFRLARQGDKDITFVGGSMNGPSMVDGVAFPRAHEGHSGWTIEDIDDIVPTPALNVDPHIILLHIGTNDMLQGASGAPQRLATLIDQILTATPDALLFVSNIIPFPGAGNAVRTYNATVPGIVAERRDAGKHILFVDQFDGFPNDELDDGVHPNEAGYARMARVWYEAISPYLP